MDNRKILDEVYRDFFGTVKEEKITPIDKEIEIKNIEELLIDEDSKELLKKIITYIKNYNNGVYINFNILLYGNNKETLNAIINLLKSVSNNYLINTNITNISLADIEDINKVKDYYKSGILIISDFNSLSGKDATKLINILKDNSTYKNIVILNDTESNLKEFIKNDNELENSYFTYSIKEILPDTKYIMNDIKKINLKTLTIMISLFTMVLSTTKVYAVDKIEGGNVTIESLGSIIKSLATKVQIFGIVLSFIALVVFVIQFIIGDDETKQRRKKTILYTLGGVALLILVPSIINFVIDTLG